MRLTLAGAALVTRAERIMAVLDEAKSELAQLRREIAGELRVAAFPSIASAVLPETVKALRTVFPQFEIVIEEMEPSDGLAALGSWRTDVALVDDISTPVRGKENVDFAPLTDDVVHVLVSASHELRARRSVTIADLKHEDWALDSTSSAFGDFIIDLCRRSGYEPRLNAKCKSFEVVATMVASGCLISVAPGLRLRHPIEGVAAVKLRPEVRRKISPLIAAAKQDTRRSRCSWRNSRVRRRGCFGERYAVQPY